MLKMSLNNGSRFAVPINIADKKINIREMRLVGINLFLHHPVLIQ